ncbi:serine hydrolase [Gramella sp. KN1008]|uniref:serine hydrolase domain-containing protein n=1 Tax=Gramella sp. KN1008 TaxID=2529298 RepID=UPI0013F15A98|nr:serine hydrolase domain-containing protein [Gramella sp. KN1008]
MKRIYLVLLCTLVFNFSHSQKAKKDYAEAFKLAEVWLEAQKDFENLPGITAAVIDDQELLWSGAFGLANMEENLKAQVSTICSICSISKLFTAVAVMKLYDEGKLRLDDRVDDILPAYKLRQKYSGSGPITIRSLLTHSSGLPREAAYPYWTGPDFPFPSKEEIDSKLGDQETLYPASTYFQYSNLGLTLLGEIVEEISGVPYDEYVKKNILEPLELSDTRPEMPKELYGEKLAIGYSSVTRAGEREKVKFFNANGITPAAGFTSNVEDLGKFASWQLRLRDTTETEILKPSTLKYMQNVHWTDPDWTRTWGLGFAVYKGPDGGTWVGHGGSCPGYRSALQIDLKNKRAFSVMINASGTNPSKYINGINGIMSKVESSKENESVETEKDLSEYAGYFSAQPWWSEAYVSPWGSKLVLLSLPSDNPQEDLTFYKHIEGDTFRRIRDDQELGETLVFERDESGQIIRFKSHGNYSEKINP